MPFHDEKETDPKSAIEELLGGRTALSDLSFGELRTLHRLSEGGDLLGPDLSFTGTDQSDFLKTSLGLGYGRALDILSQKAASGDPFTPEENEQLLASIQGLGAISTGDDAALAKMGSIYQLLATSAGGDFTSEALLQQFADLGSDLTASLSAEEEIDPQTQQITDLTLRQMEAETQASELVLKNAEADSERAAIEGFLQLVPSADRMAILAGMLEKPRFQELFFGGFAGVGGQEQQSGVPTGPGIHEILPPPLPSSTAGR